MTQGGTRSEGGGSSSADRISVGFESLAKTIGARWKNMSSDKERGPYKEKAAVSVYTLYSRLQCAPYFVLIS